MIITASASTTSIQTIKATYTAITANWKVSTHCPSKVKLAMHEISNPRPLRPEQGSVLTLLTLTATNQVILVAVMRMMARTVLTN